MHFVEINEFFFFIPQTLIKIALKAVDKLKQSCFTMRLKYDAS